MASKNSVMLIIKQNQGIKYHELLEKIVGDYSNINSARAALSRVIKDLEALGLVLRKGNKLFLTDKGVLKIQTEMKNKLLLKLNDLIKEVDSSKPGPFVQQLSTLVERAKQDKDLRKVAKSSVSFPVSRVELVKERIQKQSKHLEYLSKSLEKHIKSMKEMNFRDSIEVKNTKRKQKKIVSISLKQLKGEFIVRARDSELEELSEEFDGKIKDKSILFPAEKFEEIASFLFSEQLKDVALIVGEFKVVVLDKTIRVSGPANKIEKIKK